MAVLETYHGSYLWKYIPSFPAAIVFVALFAICTIAHAWKLFAKRMWFCIPFLIGGVFEIVGYVGRVMAHDNTGKLIPYIMQSLLLLLAPILFAATLYMTYSRIVRSVDGEKQSLISLRWTTTIFVMGDVASFFIQGGGGGILSNAKTQSKIDLGNNIIVAGLVFQVVMFAVFLVCCFIFNVRFRRHIASGNQRGSAAMQIPWQGCLIMLYVTSLAIMVRNIYRVIEYAMGDTGYLLTHEWPTYVFDGSLMVIVMVIFFLRYPSMLKAENRDSTTVELMNGGSNTNPESSDMEGPYKNSTYGPNHTR